jgi:hypothetical protein
MIDAQQTTVMACSIGKVRRRWRTIPLVSDQAEGATETSGLRRVVSGIRISFSKNFVSQGEKLLVEKDNRQLKRRGMQ